MLLVGLSWGTTMLANWRAFAVCVRICSGGTRWLSVFHFTEGFLWTTETCEVDRNIRTHPIAVVWAVPLTQGFWVWWEFSCPHWAWSKDVWSQTIRVDNSGSWLCCLLSVKTKDTDSHDCGQARQNWSLLRRNIGKWEIGENERHTQSREQFLGKSLNFFA